MVAFDILVQQIIARTKGNSSDLRNKIQICPTYLRFIATYDIKTYALANILSWLIRMEDAISLHSTHREKEFKMETTKNGLICHSVQTVNPIN